MKTTTTGTCPTCFRTMAIDSKGRVMRHGWQEAGGRHVGSYGNAWHVGACFGVGFQPFEVSPAGTVAYIEERVFPGTLMTLSRRDHLATRPALTRGGFAEYRDGYRFEKAPYEYRVRPGDLRIKLHAAPWEYPSYEDVWGSETKSVTLALEMAMAEGARLCAAVAAWKPATLGAREVRGPIVHYKPEAARKPVCFGLRSPYGARTTTDRDAVTCEKCKARSISA